MGGGGYQHLKGVGGLLKGKGEEGDRKRGCWEKKERTYKQAVAEGPYQSRNISPSTLWAAPLLCTKSIPSSLTDPPPLSSALLALCNPVLLAKASQVARLLNATEPAMGRGSPDTQAVLAQF